MTGFSEKQRQVLTWWAPGSPWRDREAIICDGAVRSGKTLAMGLGFFLWAGACFREQRFALCGKTISAQRRNLLAEILPKLRALGIPWREIRSENRILAGPPGRENSFYLFGGKDEGSAAMIQGMTLAGVLLDEAALMPRSFVDQACARCSVPGSRLWFNCNPEGPGHWLYQEWIQKAEEKGALRLHFTMEDNPGLTPEIRQRYERMYTGAFYDRYVLGKWVQAQGRVYDFFTEDMACETPEGNFDAWYISCDYGTVNPTSMGLWGRMDGIWYRVREFYFDSRREMRQMTDPEYADALETLAGGRALRGVIVDPSAASFLETLRRRGIPVRKAKNDVLSGIRLTADLLKTGKLRICKPCRDCLREIQEYSWEPGDGGLDRVRKEKDHAMDDMRYFAATVIGRKDQGFASFAVERQNKI